MMSKSKFMKLEIHFFFSILLIKKANNLVTCKALELFYNFGDNFIL